MSDMNGNPHARDAAYYIENASQINAWEVDERAVQAANGQAIATLALAYEQRTANLIAAAHLSVAIDGPSVDISKDVYQIDTRLGLNEGATK